MDNPKRHDWQKLGYSIVQNSGSWILKKNGETINTFTDYDQAKSCAEYHAKVDSLTGNLSSENKD